MEISFDPEKRSWTLEHRGLDFIDAAAVFNQPASTREDLRFEYPERRFLTVGTLRGRSVVLVWTPTAEGRRIISMRYAHAKEVRNRHR